MRKKKRRRREEKERSSERFERLTPLDKQVYGAEEPPPQPEGGDDEGVLRVTTGSLRLPEEFVPDPDSESARSANRVVLVIVALSLAFIAWIAWTIATSGA